MNQIFLNIQVQSSIASDIGLSSIRPTYYSVWTKIDCRPMSLLSETSNWAEILSRFKLHLIAPIASTLTEHCHEKIRRLASGHPPLYVEAEKIKTALLFYKREYLNDIF